MRRPAHQPRSGEVWYRLAEAETRRVRAALPAPLREGIANLPVIYAEQPGPELLADGWPDDLLGLFSGPTYGEEAATNEPLPPMIHLFIANLRAEAQDDAEAFRQEVRTTLLHEIGHYLGLDEDGLAARDLE